MDYPVCGYLTSIGFLVKGLSQNPLHPYEPPRTPSDPISKKWNTLNYMDSAPLSTLILDPMPIKRILQPGERGGHPVRTSVNQSTIDL